MAKSLRSQTLIDPVKDASAPPPKKKRDDDGLPVLDVPNEIAGDLAALSGNITLVKQLAAEGTIYKANITAWCQKTFIERQVAGDEGNFAIRLPGKTEQEDIEFGFVVKAQGKALGEAELTTLKEVVDPAGMDAMLERSKKVELNLDVWTEHHELLIRALNTKDAAGNPLVPDHVLKGLFYSPVVVKKSVVKEAVKAVRRRLIEEKVDGEQAAEQAKKRLHELLFERLKLTVAISSR